MLEIPLAGTPALTPGRTPNSFHIMLKPSGAICNLDCTYCYFLSKEELYPGSDFRMPLDLLEEYTRQYIEAQKVPEVTFAWQGGEPTLMGLDWFREAVALQQKYKRPGMRIQNALQTNGTLLDDEWCEFFAANDFLVGLSMDGPPELHDKYRVDKGGAPTHARVMRAARLFREYGVEFNILCTVHAGNDHHPLEVYRYLRDEVGTNFMQFIPIVEAGQRDRLPGRQPGYGPQRHRPAVRRLPDCHLRGVGAPRCGSGVRPDLRCGPGRLDRQPARSVHLRGKLRHGAWPWNTTAICTPATTMWSRTICWATWHSHSLLEMAGSETQNQFGDAKRDTLPQYCLDCEVRFVCNGGCPKNRFIETPDGEEGLNYLCAGYRAFFNHVREPMETMARLLAARRAPAEIMGLYRQRDQASLARPQTRVNRNAPCPCGSGRKYKACCGRRRQAMRSVAGRG